LTGPYTDAERELIARRICPCSPTCGQSVAHRRENTIYVDPAHRQRHYRSRVKAAATAAGLPAVLSLQAVEQSTPTNKRHGDAPRRRKSGQSIRISYRKTVDVVAGQLDAQAPTCPPGRNRAIVEGWLSLLLTDRQKEILRNAA
jgi:hypothetical protein